MGKKTKKNIYEITAEVGNIFRKFVGCIVVVLAAMLVRGNKKTNDEA